METVDVLRGMLMYVVMPLWLAAGFAAAAAWFAAGVGGKHRDENLPSLRWTVLGPRVIPRS